MVEPELCSFCACPIQSNDHFCPWCQKPLTSFATTDPVQSIRAEGEMIRGAIRRPTPIVVLGVSLLFGPPFFVFLWMGLYSLLEFEGRIIDRLIGLFLSLFFAWLYFTIVRRVFQGYRASRKEVAEGLADEDE